MVSGGVGIAGSVIVGNATGASAAPTSINMDLSISSTGGQHPKLNLYNNQYGLGVSSGNLDVISGGTVSIWSGSTLLSSWSTGGNLSVTGTATFGSGITSNGVLAGVTIADRVTANTGYSIFYRNGNLSSLWDSAAGNVISYTNGGFVAVGVTTPTDQLEVYSATNAERGILILNNTTAASAQARLELATGTASSYVVETLSDNAGAPTFLMLGGSAVASATFQFTSEYFYSGATQIAAVTSTGLSATTLTSSGGLITSTAASAGSVAMYAGSSTNPGYTAFNNPSNTRLGYIGWAAPTANYLALETESTALGYEVTGNLRVDGSFFMSGVSAIPVTAALTVTAVNTLSALPSSASGLFAMLIVNGQVFMSAGSSPPFTLSGTTVTWSATNAGFALATTDSVAIYYSH